MNFRNNRTTPLKKVEMANEAERLGNMSVNDESYGVELSQMGQWRKI